MELYVKLDNNLYLNPVSGSIKQQARGAIPFDAPVSVRKTKPALKYARKVGDIWLGSNKLSFAMLLAYLMLKSGKNRVIGFYSHGDEYLYIEGSVDAYRHVSISMGFTSAGEKPDVYIAISGKVYDGIFGINDIVNLEFDFIKVYKELSRRVNPAQIAVIAICIAITGYLATILLKEPPKIEVPQIMQKAPPPPPPLTQEEIDKLNIMLKRKFVEKYGETVKEIKASTGQKWLKNVTLTTASTPDSQSISANFTYASYYPFSGTKKEGNAYVWTQPYSESLARQNLAEFTRSPVSPYICLKYLINYTVTERTGNKWVVSLKENKYPRISFLLNLIYDCPCSIKEMTIDAKDGLSGTVVIDMSDNMVL